MTRKGRSARHNNHHEVSPATSHKHLIKTPTEETSVDNHNNSNNNNHPKQGESEWFWSIQQKNWTELEKCLQQVTRKSSSSLESRAHRMSTQDETTPSSEMQSPTTTPGKSKTTKRPSSLQWIFKRSVGSAMGDVSATSFASESGDRNNYSTTRSSQHSRSHHSRRIPSSVDEHQHQHHHQQASQDDTDTSQFFNHSSLLNKNSLLVTNSEGRTPLQLALKTADLPDNLLHDMLHAQPKAVSMPDLRGRLPLHFAVVKKRSKTILEDLITCYPEALFHSDMKGKTPVMYAVEVASRQTNLPIAPKEFWATSIQHENNEWQQEQEKIWDSAQWLLEQVSKEIRQLEETSDQVFSREQLSPLLIDAMLHAAPPSVVDLLIDAAAPVLKKAASSNASVVGSIDMTRLDDTQNQHRGISMGCAAMYLAIFRHYPISILKKLGSLLAACPQVKNVRDETGLGLVSCCYVTACFEKSKLLEYVAAEDFMVTLEQCIVQGQLPYNNQQNLHDSCFLEWWQKLKYLILFCTGNEQKSTAEEYLLHSALKNNDTPPNIIRLLLALYPGSARQPDTESAHPVHLFAMRRDYVPRNYESPYMHGLNVMEMLLSLDESAVFHQFQNRLPLHHAIAAGRTWTTIHSLVSNYRYSLRIPDPRTKLFPGILAAAYRCESPEEEGLRLLQLARNQYSSIVWQGLSFKQQENAVNRMRLQESLKRLDTVFELLRRFPQCLETAIPQNPPRHSKSNTSNRHLVANQKTPPPAPIRDDSIGPEMIAFHFLSWGYKKVNGKWEAVEENMQILQTAIQIAQEHRVLSKKNMDFVNWWDMLKLYFWHCYNGMDFRFKNSTRIPKNDNFLLHVAVAISTTPGILIELILGLYPDAASRVLPDSKLLPLHLACRTTAYTAQYFEVLQRPTSIELLLEASPEAAFVRVDGELPIHMAIKAGKTINELQSLIQQAPTLVKAKDPMLGLYPYQLMALAKTPSNELRLRLQTIASNRNGENWNQLPAQQKIQEIRHVEYDYQMEVFNSVFELLLLGPSVIMNSSSSGGAGIDYERSGESTSDRGASHRRQSTTSLDALSLGGGTTSNFSTIDMMSTISNVSSHLSWRRNRGYSRSFLGDDLTDDIDDQSEDSDIWSEEMSFHDAAEKEIQKRVQSSRRKNKGYQQAQQNQKPEPIPKMSLRQQKMKDKWQAPQHFSATPSTHPESSSAEDVPKEIEPVVIADDVSFLDGIDPRSKSWRGSSGVRKAVSEELNNEAQTDGLSDSGGDPASALTLTEDDMKLLRYMHPTETTTTNQEEPNAFAVAISSLEFDGHPKGGNYATKPPGNIVEFRSDDNDSIQDEIVQTFTDETPSDEEEESVVVFRLRRSVCQRQQAEMGNQQRKPTTATTRQRNATRKDFLSFLNASLPEGKMDYLSTLEVSATSLPPIGHDSLPNNLDARNMNSASNVKKMEQIKELPHESGHSAKLGQNKRDYRGLDDIGNSGSSRQRLFEQSSIHRSYETGMESWNEHIPMPGRRDIRGSVNVASQDMNRISPGSPMTSGHNLVADSPAIGSESLPSSSTIQMSPSNYIGVKPKRLKSCLNCGTHPRSVVMLPCHHLCLCLGCAEEVEINSCPICFGAVSGQRVL